VISQIDDHPQEYVANFGYRPGVKVYKFKNPFIFLLLDGTCCRYLAIPNILILKYGELGSFFHQISSWLLQSYFSS
jgi:hypothetical protein